MKNVTVIYDDRTMPGRKVRSITGDKSFGETILKRVPLTERIRSVAMNCKNTRDFIVLSGSDDFEKLNKELINKKTSENTGFLYMYSNYAIRNEEEFKTLIQKTLYVEDPYVALCSGRSAAYLIPDKKSLMAAEEELTDRSLKADEIDQDSFTDLSDMNAFLSYITGGFDARFFNALEGDAYTVTKKSNKVEKIKSEYKFYEMLPDDMKKWFVMPYDYREEAGGASYTMERIHTTDIAIRFVHGAVSKEELGDILEKLFYFIRTRESVTKSPAEVEENAKQLYITKVRERMEELKKSEQYKRFDDMIAMGTSYESIDALVTAYEDLYGRLRRKAAASDKNMNTRLVIGHGDLCFSNILYSRQAGLLKLIDPKGALEEEGMYSDAYYDIAKLSHSVCGGYDFFNSGLYQVSLDRDLKWKLSLDADLSGYREVFREYLRKEGYDYAYVRICEAGLFLSMLPYHMDQPGKVFGFLLNAIGILEEIKREENL
ncbi:MAG: aminoglycoside phosphotransferase family protein [Lachnospiraceae bacterium]|nr:aminoglycoside phosphotransferase family protein [Lachnospiraceae bacterium]